MQLNKFIALLWMTLPITSAFAEGASSDSSVNLKSIEVTAHTKIIKSTLKTPNLHIAPFHDSTADNIPYSIHVTNATEINARSAHTLLQAVQGSTPIYAVQLPANDGRGDAEPQLRGADVNFLQDGLPIGSMIRPEVELMESIDVLDGPTAAFYGFSGSGLGGTINFHMKQPLDTSLAQLELGQYLGGINNISADMSGPVNRAKNVLYRFNAYREKGSGYVQGSSQQRIFLLGAMDFKLLPQFTLKVSASHHEFDLEGQQILFKIDATKLAIPNADRMDPAKLYGQDWTFSRGHQDQALFGFISELSGVNFEGNIQGAQTYRQSRTLSGQIINNKGDYTETYSDGGPSRAWNWSGNLLTSTKVTIGNIANDISLGYTGLSNKQRSNPNASKTAIIDTVSIDHPVSHAMPELYAVTSYDKHVNTTNNTVSLQDQTKISDFASVVAGVGYSKIKSSTENHATGVTSAKYDQDGFIPSVGLLLTPINWLHPYVNWSEGLVAGGMTSTTWVKNHDEYLSPSRNDEVEAGVKVPVNINGFGLIHLSAAYYHLNKINEYIDPSDSIYKQDGREVHQGVEVSLNGPLLKHLKMQSSYTWIDASVKKAKNNISIEGKIPANIPNQQGRLELNYIFPFMECVSTMGAVNWVGKRPVDAVNSAFLPSVTTFDAGIAVSKKFYDHLASIQVNITNAFNKVYWATYKPTGTVGLGLGEPRLISISGKVNI